MSQTIELSPAERAILRASAQQMQAAQERLRELAIALLVGKGIDLSASPTLGIAPDLGTITLTGPEDA